MKAQIIPWCALVAALKAFLHLAELEERGISGRVYLFPGRQTQQEAWASEIGGQRKISLCESVEDFALI